MIRNLLGKNIPTSRWALTIGLGSSLLTAEAAFAQQAGQDIGSTPVERVIVTGSNIPTAEEVGPAPVDTVDTTARERTGAEDVETVLTKATPAISSSAGNLGQSNASIGSGSTYGGSTVSIHGLPTLILLNGRRLTDSSAAAAGGATFTDVNLFPSALVKRIEVLKDGASAIYGTEAIGGVVNVILDTDFQGFQISTRYGFAEKGDIKDQRYSGIFGFGDDKTHIVVGAEYVNQDPVFNRNRDFANPSFGTTSYAGVIRLRVPNATFDPTDPASSPFRQGVYTLNPGVTSPNGVVAPGSIPLPTAGQGNAGLEGVYNSGGVNLFPATAAAVGATSSIATQGFDLSRATGITLDQNRVNVMADADRELFGKHMIAFVDFLYASNYSQSYLNAQPLSNATGVTIPAGAPFNPFAGTIDGSNTSTVLVANRFVSAPRIFRNDADFYRVVAGLKGEIIPNVNYEVALNSSRDELTFKNPNLIIASDLNDAIAGGFTADGTPQVAGVGGATVNGPFSVVRGNLQPALDFFSANNPAAALQNFTGDNIRYLLTKFAGVDGKVDAFPVTLPGGPLGVAFGGEYRHETLKAQDSPEVFVGSVPIGEIDTGRDEFALFGETQIPLVSPDMNIPGVYRADLSGAFRYESYSTTGSAWVPKVGFTYLPIKDIAFRGTFSKSFIAPTLYQLQGPASNGFTAAFDLGAGSEQAQVISGSNPDLASTRADTYTVGLVISPRMVEGLTLSADFFHVEEKRIVSNIDPVTALNSVNTLGAASPFAGLVHFGNFNGPTGTIAPGGVAGNAPLLFVNNQLQNLGGQRIGGIDFGAHYTHDFGNFGNVNIGIDGTYYMQYKEQTVEGALWYNVLGYYTGQATEFADYHLTPAIDYQWGGAKASLLCNYIPSVRDAHNIGLQGLDPTPAIGLNADKPAQIKNAIGQDHFSKIRDYYTLDLLLSYEFGLGKQEAPVPTPKDSKDGKDGKDYKSTGKQMVAAMQKPNYLDGLKLSFGINNLTNARPPLIESSPDSTNTDAAIYDPYQRYYYFVVSKKF